MNETRVDFNMTHEGATSTAELLLIHVHFSIQIRRGHLTITLHILLLCSRPARPSVRLLIVIVIIVLLRMSHATVTISLGGT